MIRVFEKRSIKEIPIEYPFYLHETEDDGFTNVYHKVNKEHTLIIKTGYNNATITVKPTGIYDEMDILHNQCQASEFNETISWVLKKINELKKVK